MSRAETGVMTFDDDWFGVFIRGDNALMYYAPAIEQALLYAEDDFLTQMALKSLLNLLQSADQRTNINAQRMKPFDECLK